VNFTLPGGPGSIGPTLAATGAAVEEAGLDNVSFMDHYFQLEFLAGANDPMLEGYTTLGFLAAHTSTVELQLLMTGVTYRHPGLLAKIVSTLDVVSGGVPPSVSVRPGTNGSTAPSACRSRRRPSVSNGSRRPCSSCARCGATTTAPTPGSTTSSPRRSTHRNR
jgi:hypothetical protein